MTEKDLRRHGYLDAILYGVLGAENFPCHMLRSLNRLSGVGQLAVGIAGIL